MAKLQERKRNSTIDARSQFMTLPNGKTMKEDFSGDNLFSKVFAEKPNRAKAYMIRADQIQQAIGDQFIVSDSKAQEIETKAENARILANQRAE